MAKQRMQKFIARAVIFSLVGAGLIGSSCSSSVLSLPCIPPIPTTPSYYPPPAQGAQSTSINFELDNQYITALVQSLVQTPNASSGINVTGTTLSEQGTGNNVVNLLTVDFLPWQGNPQAQFGNADSPWQLDLTITPYLVNSQTVPNPANLTDILGPNMTEGLVLQFGYSAMRYTDGSNVTSLSTCPSSSGTTTDFVTYLQQSVLAGILSKLANPSVTRIIFPTGKLAHIANSLVSQPTPMDVNGVNVGTDGSLKLGFAFSHLPACNGCQPSETFDPSPTYNPGEEPGTNYDWNLDITPGFFQAVLWTKIVSQVNDLFIVEPPTVTNIIPSLEYTGPDLSAPPFSNSPIIATVYMDATGSFACPGSGSFNMSVPITIAPNIVADPKNGDSVMQETQGIGVPDPGTGDGFKYGCWLIDQGGPFPIILLNLLGPGQIGGDCPNVQGEPIKLNTPSGDVLYGSGIVTAYGGLLILGRSQLLDDLYAEANKGARRFPPLPPC